jgi:hypothetical protein
VFITAPITHIYLCFFTRVVVEGQSASQSSLLSLAPDQPNWVGAVRLVSAKLRHKLTVTVSPSVKAIKSHQGPSLSIGWLVAHTIVRVAVNIEGSKWELIAGVLRKVEWSARS